MMPRAAPACAYNWSSPIDAKALRLQERHLLEAPVDDGLRVEAEPILDESGVDLAEVQVVLQVTALFLLARLERRVLAIDTALDRLTDGKGDARGPMVGARTVVRDARFTNTSKTSRRPRRGV